MLLSELRGEWREAFVMGLTMSHVLLSDMCLVMPSFPEWNTCSDLVRNLLEAAWSIAPS